ncbi:putative acyl-CoA dehydrogenase [Nakamurella panacisegetis]|uniref:Putative acyl-CoA dehydrogenase n=1 Tax=Nakamurella panacisegetis TaxID=1090615 RepID=A0A1H0IGY6_9ACTN|nr:acyl-CoA dehydrogenase family protein [Nakamurella panacisegetis]SDO30729.1 putative acyl-CoA dehydrogenase [Nakamurella panacisegetis]
MTPTHVVLNQVPPLVGVDVTAADPALAAAGPVDESLRELGSLAGSAETIEAARLANACSPVLRTFDGTGHRIDEVEFHPAWHTLMRHAVGAGLAGATWASADPHAHRRRAAAFYVWTQAEAGHLCPISMTYAAVATLRESPELMAEFGPGLTSLVYQPGLTDPSGKAGLLAGMSMTEKQGGSDVRAGTTRAVPDAAGGDIYRLTGHKWFTSAPMNDLFLTLAQAPGGLTCFLLPRVLPGGERNTMALQRLKDKLGNRSNASAEVEYDAAMAHRVGDEGAGVRTILRMVTMTRLDCVLGSAGGLRAALSQATHHAAHRIAFGRRLADQPAMTAVLADLAVESWASTSIGLRLAAAVDAGETTLLRIALPVSKFWVCKQAVPAVAEALECLGGNGYVEESVMPRLFRESPLNGIWEGSGNVAALDAVRAVTRSPDPGEALLAELSPALGVDRHFDAAVTRLRARLRDPDEISARELAGSAARLFGASLLLRSAPAQVSGLYCATRLAGSGARAYGELPRGFDLARIVAAVTPGPD